MQDAYRKAIQEYYVNRPLTAAKDAAIQTAIFGGVTSIANGIKYHTSSNSVKAIPEINSDAQLSAKQLQDISTEPNSPPIDNNVGTKVLHQEAESKSKGTDVVELMLRKSSNSSDGENVTRADRSSSQTSNPFVAVAKQSAADAQTGAFLRNLWGKDYNAKVNELIANGQESAKSVVNWSYANEAAKIISTGKDLTDVQLGRLYRNNGQKENKSENIIRSDLDNPLLKVLQERETTNPLTEKTAPSAEKTDALDVDGSKSGEYTEFGKSGTEGAGDYQELLKQSTCNTDDFYKYLNKINSDYADTYAKTGKWPSDVQIPKNSDVLKADGTINWDEVPNGGYVLDGKGDAIKEQYVPGIGETIDRHGPNNGRFTSPVRNNKPYSYAQRSLPYMENPSQYHRYKVTGDLSNIEQYFIKSTDANLKQMISAYMKKFRLSFSDLETYRGKIASGFGEIGGGEQYELPLPVNMLEGLGLLKEF